MPAFTGSPLVAGWNLGKQHTGTGEEAFADQRCESAAWPLGETLAQQPSPFSDFLPRTPLLGSALSRVLGDVPSVAGVLGGHSSIPFLPLASVHPSVNGVVRKPCRTHCARDLVCAAGPVWGGFPDNSSPGFCRRDWEGMWLCSFLAVLQYAFAPTSHTCISDH